MKRFYSKIPAMDVYLTILVFGFIIPFSIILIYLSFFPLSEGFSLETEPSCPDILIEKGGRFHLYNSRRAEVPGVNPITFKHLEDYTEFIKWQRANGIYCPVLYLKEIYNTQGNPIYKPFTSPYDLTEGSQLIDNERMKMFRNFK